MGRQAYLTKIALGRSAFEIAQTTASSSEYVQLASAQQDRAHEHGRRLREAQNDVLASIGVVERRYSPPQGLPGSYEHRLRGIEEEDTVGSTLGYCSRWMTIACTWWVGSLRERILIVASEKSLSGKTLLYSGFPSRHLSKICGQVLVYGACVLRPLDRLLMKHGTLRMRHFYRRWRVLFNTGFWISFELLLYPFLYHSHLQRVGLAPARPLFPPLKSFVPFSAYSPLLPFSTQHDALASPVAFLKAFLTSPFVLMCIEHSFERWVDATISEPLEATIIHPSNPDMISPEEGNKERIFGLRKQSPRFVHNTISKVLRFIGWGDATAFVEHRPIPVASHVRELQDGDTIEVGRRQVSNINRLEVLGVPHDALAVPGTEVIEMITVPISSLSEERSPPLSPTASQTSHNDGDPRIRITAREPRISMEVRLPPHVLSSHTEMAGSGPPTPIQRDMASPVPTQVPGMVPYHRVTSLSSEPSSMIGLICKAQMMNWVLLPLKLVTLKLVASHYLAGRKEPVGSRSVYNGLILPSELDWKSIGVLVSRLALCGVTELAIDFTIWGCQYWAVSWLGTRAFHWGAL